MEENSTISMTYEGETTKYIVTDITKDQENDLGATYTMTVRPVIAGEVIKSELQSPPAAQALPGSHESGTAASTHPGLAVLSDFLAHTEIVALPSGQGSSQPPASHFPGDHRLPEVAGNPQLYLELDPREQ